MVTLSNVEGCFETIIHVSTMLNMTHIAENAGLHKDGVQTRIALEIRNPINEFLNRRMKSEGRVGYTETEARIWKICAYSVNTLLELELKGITARIETEGPKRRGM